MAGAAVPAAGAVGEPDGHVPNYNIFGQQHHRNPTKDKGHFAKIAKEKPEWTRTPRFRTRSEMFAARRAAKHPDLSYDLDGDGAVGATDYFIGKIFSEERDHRLNTAERHTAVQALENGLLDHYSFGHDHFGAKRPFATKQIRGKIISVDNVHELNEVYPPHWNAEKVPRFKTATEMVQHRRAEQINAADSLRIAYDAKFPSKVPEPPVPKDPLPSTYGQSNSEKRGAWRREAREQAGLDPHNSYVNPNREAQSGTTLDYIEDPVDKTRSGMRERRKMKMLEELQQNRVNGELDFVPFLARHTKQDAVEYEERRPQPEALTLNKLLHQRKTEKIEHNLNNFGWRATERPRYSDQETAWWKMQDGYVVSPPPPLLKEIHEPTQEVAMKVTELCPHPVAPSVNRGLDLQDRPPSNAQQEVLHNGAFDESEHKTLHRWTTEFVPQGVAQREPRFFDGVKQAPTYSLDTAELDQFSSFSCIAKTSIMQEDSRQRKVAKDDEDRAHAWKLNMQGLPNHTDKGDDLDSVSGARFTSTSKGPPPGATAPLPLSSRESAKRPPVPPRVPNSVSAPRVPNSVSEVRRLPLRSFPPLAEPAGEDVPMTERLERIITGRQAGNYLATVSENANTSGAPLQKDSSSRSFGKTAKGGDRTLRATMQPRTSAVDPQSLVVRTGGFQWINSQTPKFTSCMVEDPSNSSLLRTMQGQETTPRSRSASRMTPTQAAPA